MEREIATDSDPVYVRAATEFGTISLHAETLILGDDGDDTLYGEIVATTDETRDEGDMFEVRVSETANDPDFAPFFA